VTSRSGTGLPPTGRDRDRIETSAVGRLATGRPDGTPHLVPVTFALAADVLVTAVDAKPKSTTDLQRIRNLRANPAFSLLVDAYADDWTRLWWVRIDGVADVVEDEPARSAAVQPLVAKYAQYRDGNAPTGPVLVLHPQRWTAWSAD